MEEIPLATDDYHASHTLMATYTLDLDGKEKLQ